MPPFRILPAGDSALLVELPARIDPALNTWCVALAESLTLSLGAVVRDVVIGYCSVTIYFDPLAVDAAWLEAEVRARADRLDVATVTEGPLVEVPVCYGGDLGPDLADVAAFAGCLRSRRDRGAHRPGLPRLHGRVRSRLCLHGRSRPSDRRAAPIRRREWRCRLVRSRSPAARLASIRPRRRAAGTSSAGRRSCLTIPTGQSPFSSRLATGSAFAPCRRREIQPS